MQNAQISPVRSHLGPREVRSLEINKKDKASFEKSLQEWAALDSLGISFERMNMGSKENLMAAMAEAHGFACDSQISGITSPSIDVPIQFLQNWLPGFIRVMTAARKIDELVGITTTGSWEDQEVVQGILEPIGNAVPYQDYSQVPLSSWNVNFERRTVVPFEKGLQVGALEEARASRMRVNSAQEKRGAIALQLEIQRNLVGFNGYNSGNNRTYGFLNDPNLPSYVTVATGAGGGTPWSGKSFIEITSDIRTGFAALQTQTQDTVDLDSKITMGIATTCAAYLTVTAVYGTKTVREWFEETFPNGRIVSAPQLNGANGGANVFYLYAEEVDDGASDDSRVWVQPVPAKFQMLGVEKRAKSYIEDYASATAGVFLKRPYAVYRGSGI